MATATRWRLRVRQVSAMIFAVNSKSRCQACKQEKAASWYPKLLHRFKNGGLKGCVQEDSNA